MIAAAANRLAVNKRAVKLRKVENENMLLTDSDKAENRRNIIRDAAHAAKICLEWSRKLEKEGLSKPNASFVVAVDPTTEPTSPTVSIKAG